MVFVWVSGYVQSNLAEALGKINDEVLGQFLASKLDCYYAPDYSKQTQKKIGHLIVEMPIEAQGILISARAVRHAPKLFRQL